MKYFVKKEGEILSSSFPPVVWQKKLDQYNGSG